MKKRWLLLLSCLFLVLAACSAKPESTTASVSQADTPEVVVYKLASCGCCGDWVEHMEAYGFQVQVHEVNDLSAVKAEHGVSPELQSCHTALVDGYVVEGHVPATDVFKLLRERPNVIGVAVPGMPVGSPGMETSGVQSQPYDVLTFDEMGATEVFASYR